MFENRETMNKQCPGVDLFNRLKMTIHTRQFLLFGTHLPAPI